MDDPADRPEVPAGRKTKPKQPQRPEADAGRPEGARRTKPANDRRAPGTGRKRRTDRRGAEK